jgi:hypothetical protein
VNAHCLQNRYRSRTPTGKEKSKYIALKRVLFSKVVVLDPGTHGYRSITNFFKETGNWKRRACEDAPYLGSLRRQFSVRCNCRNRNGNLYHTQPCLYL